jgi:hypothetical protein
MRDGRPNKSDMTGTLTRTSPPSRAAAGACAALTAIALAFTGGSTSAAQAPAPPSAEMHFNTGQSVVPIYEGWTKESDGTYYFVFGYYNRNFLEEPSIAIGAANGCAPGPADCGQPTFFYARVNHNVFRVNVPADWGKRELIWALTYNNVTERAVATLLPELEIERPQEWTPPSAKNQPPTLTVDVAARTIVLPGVLTLTARLADDGNPPFVALREGERVGVGGVRRRVVNQGKDGFPSLHKGERGPVNVPLLPPMPRPLDQGLQIGWILYRGPASVTISPSGFHAVADKKSGVASATVTFAQSGDYVFRGIASDGLLRAVQEIAVSVKGSVGTPSKEP